MHFMELYSYLSSWSSKTHYGELFYFHYFHQRTASEPESYNFKLSSCFQVLLLLAICSLLAWQYYLKEIPLFFFLNYIYAENKLFSTQQTRYSQSCNMKRNKKELSYLSTTKADFIQEEDFYLASLKCFSHAQSIEIPCSRMEAGNEFQCPESQTGEEPFWAAVL